MEEFPGPVPENIHPIFAEAVTDAEVDVVPYNRAEPVRMRVEVVNAENPTQAYAITSQFQELNHGGGLLWGYIYRGFILPRAPGPADFPPVFYEPSYPTGQMNPPGRPHVPLEQVVIKKLIRAVVEPQFRRGHPENWRMEIHRLQHLGDDQRAIRPVEVLQSKDFIYIITRFCQRGSLRDHCYSFPNRDVEARARFYFRQMLEAVQWLHTSHSICHRDLDPSNFLVTGDHRVLLTDFAMSFRVPQGGRVRHIGTQGKPQFLAPEIVVKWHFEALQTDLWACVVTLFCMVAGVYPIMVASQSDIGFRLMQRIGTIDQSNEERLQEILHQVGWSESHLLEPSEELRQESRRNDEHRLGELVPRIADMSPELRELFHHCFRENPAERWHLKDVLNCQWMAMDLPQLNL